MTVESSFRHDGQRIAYAEYGDGDRVLVLIHGLLMNRHMYDHLGAGDGLARLSRDHRRPARPRRLRQAGRHARLQHGGVRRPGRGAARAPRARPADRRRHLARRQRLARARDPPPASRPRPLHRDAGARQRPGRGRSSSSCRSSSRCGSESRPCAGCAALTNRIPRSNYLVDIMLDWTRRPPEASEAVLQGLLLRPHRPTARGARADRGPGARHRPPRRPAASVHRLRHARRRGARRPAASTPSRSSSGGSAPGAWTASWPTSWPRCTPPRPPRPHPPADPGSRARPGSLRSAKGCPASLRRS